MGRDVLYGKGGGIWREGCEQRCLHLHKSIKKIDVSFLSAFTSANVRKVSEQRFCDRGSFRVIRSVRGEAAERCFGSKKRFCFWKQSKIQLEAVYVDLYVCSTQDLLLTLSNILNNLCCSSLMSRVACYCTAPKLRY